MKKLILFIALFSAAPISMANDDYFAQVVECQKWLGDEIQKSSKTLDVLEQKKLVKKKYPKLGELGWFQCVTNPRYY